MTTVRLSVREMRNVQNTEREREGERVCVYVCVRVCVCVCMRVCVCV